MLSRKPKVEKLLKELPALPGVYFMKDEAENILYIGKAKNLKNRVKSYFQTMDEKPIRTKKMLEKVDHFEWVEVNSDYEAYVLESNLIKAHQPKYNVLLKDDKHFIYFKITKEDYPRIKVVRKVVQDGSLYIGPKSSQVDKKKTLSLVQKLFPFRSCDLGIEYEGPKLVQISNKSIAYPCIDYHIKRCLGPCIGEISPEDYQINMKNIVEFLKGNTKEVEANLIQKMQEAAANKNFERAAQLRDTFKSIEALKGRQIVSGVQGENIDAIGFSLGRNRAYLSIFQSRDGKVSGVENFHLEAHDFELNREEDVQEILVSAIQYFYEFASDFPEKILVPLALEDDFLEENLSQKASHRVSLVQPQIGAKAELLDLAMKQAANYQKQQSIQWQQGHDEAEALQGLQEFLHLSKPLKRIECYDISHLSGENTVASMVVLEQGRIQSALHRKFIIKSLAKGEIDDFKSMKEVLSRRLQYLSLSWTDWSFHFSKKENSLKLEVKKETEPVAYLKIQIESNRPSIQALWVKPELRNQGLGEEMLRRMAQKHKLKNIKIKIPENRIPYYEELGFQASKRRDLKGEWVLKTESWSDRSLSQKPDLIVIDGGKGQLSSVLSLFETWPEDKLPIIALAKREEEIFRPNQKTALLLPKESPMLHILQKIRNEAHRFALEFQRSKRKKTDHKTALDDFTFLKAEDKSKLFHVLSSWENIQKQDLEVLSSIIGEKKAMLLMQAISNHGAERENRTLTPCGTGF